MAARRAPTAPTASPVLGEDIKRQLCVNGVAVVPGVVSEELRQDALRTINAAVGRGVDKEALKQHKNGVQFPDIMGREAIVNLFNRSGARPLLESLTGPLHPVWGGQIALRFPGAMCVDADGTAPVPYWCRGWHIDGLPFDIPAHKPGRLETFSCLVGVVLRDIPADFCGNFVALPGSHHALARHFREAGPAAVEEKGSAGFPKDLPLPPPRQVRARAGDLVLANYLLAHSIAPNTSASIRYCVYFRVKAKATHPDPEGYRRELLLDPLAEWPGLRATAAALGAAGGGPPRPEDRDFATLLPVATQLYDTQQWADCAPIYQRLAALRPADYMLAFRGATALVWGHWGAPDKMAEAERLTRQALAVMPRLTDPHCALARCLAIQGRHQAALDALCSGLLDGPKCAPPEWGKELLADALKVIHESCASLKRGDAAVLAARLTARYPMVAGREGEASMGAELKQLWERGKQLLAQPQNFAHNCPEGRVLFARIAELQPGQFGAVLLTGVCHTYDPKARPDVVQAGEAFARQAVDLEPQNAAPRALLARNLAKQGQRQAARDVLVDLLACPDARIKKGDDHEWLLTDAVRCAKTAMGAGPKFQEFVELFCTQFPGLAAHARHVANSEGCQIM